jgi:hypothetical protein
MAIEKHSNQSETNHDDCRLDKPTNTSAPAVVVPEKDEVEDELEFLQDVAKAAEKRMRDEESNCRDKSTTMTGAKIDKVNETLAKDLFSLEKAVLVVDDIPVTSLHRSTMGIQRLPFPGAVHITPESHFLESSNVEDTNESSTTFYNSDLRSSNLRRASVELTEAELVVPQQQQRSKQHDKCDVDVERALPYVARAELIDDDVLNRMRNESLEGIHKHQQSKKKSMLTVISMVLIVVLVIVLSVVLTHQSSNDGNIPENSPTDNISSPTTHDSNVAGGTDLDALQPGELGSDHPNMANITVTNFPRITQHALLFESIMDCEQITSAPSIFMRIQCGNTNPNDGNEAIQLESSSSNVICRRERNPNSLECNVDFTSSVNRFATVFTCGNNNTVDGDNQDIRFSTANVRTYPVTGVSCRSAPKLTIAHSRLCSNPGQDLNTLSLLPAMDVTDSCPMNAQRQEGEWSLCESQATCSTGQFPCSTNVSVGSITAFDYIEDDRCENLGGNVNRYERMDLPDIWNQIASIFKVWHNVTD